jgi:hypothetical protein
MSALVGGAVADDEIPCVIGCAPGCLLQYPLILLHSMDAVLGVGVNKRYLQQRSHHEAVIDGLASWES